MLKKRFVLIFLILVVLLSGIVVILQLNSRNQAAHSVNLKSLAMISSLDGWAIGDSSQRNPVILHYDGRQWKATKNTILDPFMSLSSIKMVSSTEGWIVGETTLSFSKNSSQNRPVGVILHYVEGKWILISDKMSPLPVLHGLFVLSAHNVWAVGDEGTILHYNGIQWTKITSPVVSNILSLIAVSATSSNDVWVTGWSGTLLHYNGAVWKRVTTSILNAGAANLSSISMVSADDGWIVGNISNSSQGIIWHYQGGQWQEVQDIAIDNDLQSVYMFSSSDGWAVGDAGIFLHYTNHTWTKVESSANVSNILLSGVSLISSHDGWVVGGLGTVLHYQNNTWNTYNNVQY